MIELDVRQNLIEFSFLTANNAAISSKSRENGVVLSRKERRRSHAVEKECDNTEARHEWNDRRVEGETPTCVRRQHRRSVSTLMSDDTSGRVLGNSDAVETDVCDVHISGAPMHASTAKARERRIELLVRKPSDGTEAASEQLHDYSTTAEFFYAHSSNCLSLLCYTCELHA